MSIRRKLLIWTWDPANHFSSWALDSMAHRRDRRRFCFGLGNHAVTLCHSSAKTFSHSQRPSGLSSPPNSTRGGSFEDELEPLSLPTILIPYSRRCQNPKPRRTHARARKLQTPDGAGRCSDGGSSPGDFLLLSRSPGATTKSPSPLLSSTPPPYHLQSRGQPLYNATRILGSPSSLTLRAAAKSFAAPAPPQSFLPYAHAASLPPASVTRNTPPIFIDIAVAYLGRDGDQRTDSYQTRVQSHALKWTWVSTDMGNEPI
ncbi:hypothetical protein C8F01DRAFT_1082902 [Mycena amicta]|nr:hypothetical protein C8F01DRAFT_1082902 [Mycena amicta]